MKPNEPFISICIPTYNRGKFLKEAIESALSQTYKNYEIIVVDDGSTDNTEEIVLGFNSDKIRYFKKAHSNCPDTRNKTLMESKGEYIIWLDDDDIFAENLLEVYVDYVNKYPDADIFYCHLLLFDEQSGIFNEWIYQDWYKRKDEIVAHLIKGQPNPQPSSLISRKVLNDIGFYDISINVSSDYDFYSRIIITKKYEFKLVNQLLYKYRYHGGNICYNALGKPSNYYDTKTLRKLISAYELKIFFPHFDWKNKYISSLAEAQYTLGIRFFNYFAYSDSIFYLSSSLRIERNIEQLNNSIQAFIDRGAIKELKIFLFLVKDLFEDIAELKEVTKIINDYKDENG